MDFGILLRLSDLQTIRTEQDQRDLIRSQHVWADSSWLMVDFDNIYQIDHNRNEGYYMLPRFGPFDRDQNMEYSLVHFESVQSINEGQQDSREYGHVEYFFDLPKLTRIECETHRTITAPFRTFTSCDHRFFIPDLNVMAEAFYTKKNLPRWREIEDRAHHIVRSFVVGH